MKEKSTNIAYCGIYCSECSFKVAYETQNIEHLFSMPEKYEKFKKTALEDCKCLGCKQENICGDCEIKDCAISKNLEHCGECLDFPCKLVTNFANDGMPHHKSAFENLEYIRNNGMKEFLNKMNEYIYCDCGAKLSWYLTKCLNCGKVR